VRRECKFQRSTTPQRLVVVEQRLRRLLVDEGVAARARDAQEFGGSGAALNQSVEAPPIKA